MFNLKLSMNALLRYLYYFLIIALPYFSFLAILTGLPFGLFANIILLIMVIISLSKGVNVKNWLLFLILSLFLLAIIFFKKITFDIGLREMAGSRYYLIVFLYYYISIWLVVNGALKLDLIFKLIIINSLIQALFGIAHNFIFPSFNITMYFMHGADLDSFMQASGMSRETGLLLNSNAYGNFLLLGLFLIINKMFNRKDHNLLMYLFCFILLLGIILSRSRFAIAFSLLATGLYILKFGFNAFKTKSYKQLIFIIIIIPFIMWGGLKQINKAFDRSYFFENRALKINTALTIMKSDVRYILIGAPQEIHSNQIGDDPHSVFSDNSYLETALKSGVPFAVFYFVLFFSIFFLSRTNFKSYFFIFYMLSLMFLTNCMGWNYWILYVFPVYFILVGQDAVIAGKFLIRPNNG
jgi:hypothetical protein